MNLYSIGALFPSFSYLIPNLSNISSSNSLITSLFSWPTKSLFTVFQLPKVRPWFIH